MEVERVTRDHVRNIPVGETRVFTLPDYKAVQTASTVFSMMKKREGIECQRVETGETLTIAYKRIK